MIEYKAQILNNGIVIGQISSYSMEGLEEQLHKLENIEKERDPIEKKFDELLGRGEWQKPLDAITGEKCDSCGKGIPENDLGWGLTDEPSDDRLFCSAKCLVDWEEANSPADGDEGIQVEGVDYV
ncbi:MAG: hypothetical protein M0R80_27715 [Proteobacteria bacterium]|jgi:hypothetical protein|nr:hypothetical protein [Pseudomonadota bacterium]